MECVPDTVADVILQAELAELVELVELKSIMISTAQRRRKKGVDRSTEGLGGSKMSRLIDNG